MIVDIDLCPGKEISETEISYRNLENKYREVLPGSCLNYPSIRGDLNFSARGINDVMTCFDTEFCPYSEIGAIPSLISLYWISTNRNFVHNESRMIKNKFLIFGDQKLKDEWLNDLSEIRLVKSTEKSFPK